MQIYVRYIYANDSMIQNGPCQKIEPSRVEVLVDAKEYIILFKLDFNFDKDMTVDKVNFYCIVE